MQWSGARSRNLVNSFGSQTVWEQAPQGHPRALQQIHRSAIGSLSCSRKCSDMGHLLYTIQSQCEQGARWWRSGLRAQWVKDPVLSLLWCRFDPCPWNFCMPWAQPKKKICVNRRWVWCLIWFRGWEAMPNRHTHPVSMILWLSMK